ncbi:hypothetical protein VTK56DRAFT_6841 [Thermocarpiscus australiensis]
MATDFVMPQLPGQQQQQQAFYLNQQQQRQQYHPQQRSPFHPPPFSNIQPTQYDRQVTPLSTPGSTPGSDTSPRKTYLTRQIRPLYVPAVLRPTEFPSKEPPSRPRTRDEDAMSEQNVRPNSSFMNLGGLGGLGTIGRLSRRSTCGSAESAEDNWNLDRFPKPTGAPTRKHWKPDQQSSICDHPTCKRYFNYWTRRHHCRRCGNIFCDAHSAFEIPLDQDANYNPRGVPSRACAHCYSQFKEWRSRTNSESSYQGPSDATQLETPTTPVSASPVHSLNMPLHTPDAAHSVPRDWNWSTF